MRDVSELGRFFIHLTISRRRLVGFWAMSVDQRPDYGLIEFPDFDVEAALAATNRWLATEDLVEPAARQSALLEIVRIASTTIAAEVYDVLFEKGVRHLVISPIWFLELWPLHCAEGRAADGRPAPLCDLF